MSKMYNTKEVAKIMEVHPLTVRNWINTGILKAKKIGKEWRISEENLQELMQNGNENREQK